MSSSVTFFGEVRDLTSRAVDDSDDEDDVAVDKLHVNVSFDPEDLSAPAPQQLFVSVVTRLPRDLPVLCNINADSESGFTAKLVQLSADRLWLAVRFETPLRRDSWQTRVIADVVMKKIKSLASRVTVVLVDRAMAKLQQLNNQLICEAMPGVDVVRVPHVVCSPWEAAVFEWCTSSGKTPCSIILVPGPDSLPVIPGDVVPTQLVSSLHGLRLIAADSNMFT